MNHNRGWPLLLLAAVLIIGAACRGDDDAGAPAELAPTTVTSEPTRGATPEATPTPEPTSAPAPLATATSTATPAATSTQAPTSTPTAAAATSTPTPQATSTPAVTATATPTPTPTPVPTATAPPTPTATPAPTGTPAPQAHAVSIVDFTHVSITVGVGDTVRWTNTGASPHTTTANDRAWDSGTLGMGGSFRATFSSAGSFAYLCTIHPFMTGTITVQ